MVDAFHGKAGELLLTYDAGSNLTTVFADVDGDSVSDGTFALNGNHSRTRTTSSSSPPRIGTRRPSFP